MVHFFVYNIFFCSFFDYFINSNFKIFQSQMNNLQKKIILKKDTKNILKTKKCAAFTLTHYTLCNKIDIDPKDPNSNFADIKTVFFS